MKFEIHQCADISTKEIVPLDFFLEGGPDYDDQLVLLSDVSFTHTIAVYDEGCVMYTGLNSCDMASVEKAILDFGFLPRMVEIFAAAREQGIRWICFDRDGAEIE